MIPVSLIVHDPKCAMCGSQKMKDNHWWQAIVDDRGRLIIDRMKPPIAENKSYLCGENDLIKLVQMYMTERGSHAKVPDVRGQSAKDHAKG